MFSFQILADTHIGYLDVTVSLIVSAFHIKFYEFSNKNTLKYLSGSAALLHHQRFSLVASYPSLH